MEDFDEDSNSIGLRANLDLPKKIQEQTSIQLNNYQQRVAWYYNSRVIEKSFIAGQLIFHRAEVFHPTK